MSLLNSAYKIDSLTRFEPYPCKSGFMAKEHLSDELVT